MAALGRSLMEFTNTAVISIVVPAWRNGGRSSIQLMSWCDGTSPVIAWATMKKLRAKPMMP